MDNDLRWYAATRQQLPGILVGMEQPDGREFNSPEEAMSPSTEAVVGYMGQHSRFGTVASPAVVLLDQTRAPDFLSWLMTYSEESFPLSQYCQVQTLVEWKTSGSSKRVGQVDQSLTRVAASLIVGEMLAQAESDLNLSSVPLSWANGCFTLPMAVLLGRAEPADELLTRTITDRLRACESNPRFARRPVGVRALVPMWSMLTQHSAVHGPLPEICLTVLDAVDKRAGELVRRTDALHSNSVEERVRGFDAIADKAMSMAEGPGADRNAAGVLLACSALLVGGTTSHLELLRPSVADFPESLAWFGLMAGFAGPIAWDPPWLRLTKGVERQISAQMLAPTASGGGDLSWLEYEWLTGLATDESVYTGFPKQYLRMLAVEVLPGAPCQFRLQSAQVSKQSAASDSGKSLRGPKNGSSDRPSSFSTSVPSADRWERIRHLVQSLSEVMQQPLVSGPNSARQPGLFGGEPAKPDNRGKPSKPRGKSPSKT